MFAPEIVDLGKIDAAWMRSKLEELLTKFKEDADMSEDMDNTIHIEKIERRVNKLIETIS